MVLGLRRGHESPICVQNRVPFHRTPKQGRRRIPTGADPGAAQKTSLGSAPRPPWLSRPLFDHQVGGLGPIRGQGSGSEPRWVPLICRPDAPGNAVVGRHDFELFFLSDCAMMDCFTDRVPSRGGCDEVGR